MRRLIFAASIIAAAVSPACADPKVLPTDRAEIRHVITAQIDAFRHDDGDAALGFATVALQQKFGDGAHFLAIVKQDYPAVYRPRSFRFEDVDTSSGLVIQRVDIVGPGGEVVVATYSLAHGADGGWRISGCSLGAADQIEL